MGKNYLLTIILFCGLMIPSCSSIQVSEGPYTIEFNKQTAEGKQGYLNSLQAMVGNTTGPNILLILVDDLGRDDISVYNREGVATPHLKRLAESGITFSNAYSTSSVCSPSRASMLTGRYQHRFGFERQPMNRYPRNRLEYFMVDHFVNTEPMRLLNPMAAPSREDIRKQGEEAKAEHGLALQDSKSG